MADSSIIDFAALKKTCMQSYREFEQRLTLLEAEVQVKYETLFDKENIKMLLQDIWHYYSEIKQLHQDFFSNKETTTTEIATVIG